MIFTEGQALSLVMAVLESGPAGTDGENVLGAAMDKVTSVLPEAGQRALTSDSGNIVTDQNCELF